MLGIKQSRDHLTNQSLYQVPRRETIHERQLKFTGHYIRMPTDEPANRLMNQGLNHLFDQEHQGRHNSIKFRRTFYNLASNLSKQES